tara:strand:+ start:279 stop:629 length:351 start_codon:yes stop_codon:yes gene_type:complete
MSIKLVLLKSEEQVITEIKEIMDKDSPVGYLLTQPHRVVTSHQVLVEEGENPDDNAVSVTLSPWILLTTDKEIAVPNTYVTTIVEPIDSLTQMYLEKVNGNQPDISDEPGSIGLTD